MTCCTSTSLQIILLVMPYSPLWMDSPDKSDSDCLGGSIKTSFITHWEIFCYKAMPFSLKYKSLYKKSMTTISHYMIHKIWKFMWMISKSITKGDHLVDLEKIFEQRRKYDLKINPSKCVFGTTFGKLQGLTVSKRGKEINPPKIKAVTEMTSL